MEKQRDEKWTAERIERMIRWLRANETRICAVSRIQVTFDCAGQSIKTDVREGGEA